MFMNELGPEYGGGNYFIHKKSSDSCDMLISGKRACIGVSGPPTPDYESCF